MMVPEAKKELLGAIVEKFKSKQKIKNKLPEPQPAPTAVLTKEQKEAVTTPSTTSNPYPRRYPKFATGQAIKEPAAGQRPTRTCNKSQSQASQKPESKK